MEKEKQYCKIKKRSVMDDAIFTRKQFSTRRIKTDLI